MNHLKQVFPIAAQIISGRVGVKVEIGGDTASYSEDQNLIHLPALPLDKPELAEAAWGYQYHEAFHAKYTDMDLFKAASGKPLRVRMLNIIEDIWDENHMPKEFYTAKSALDAMNLKIMGDGGFDPSHKDDHPAAVLCAYVLYQGIAYFNNLPQLQPNADQTESVLRELFPRGVVTKLNAILDDGIPSIKCTQDSLALTDRILQMLEEEDNNPEDNQGDDRSSTSDSEDDQNHSTASSQSGNQPNPSRQEEGSGNGQQNSSDSSQSDSTTTGQSSDNRGNGTGKGQQPSVIAQALNAVESDLPKDKSEYIQSILSEGSTTQYAVAKPAPLGAYKSGERGEESYDKATKASTGARRQLQRLVESAYRNQPKVRSFGSRLDQNRMHRAMFANPNVFRHVGKRLKKDTAFHILVDTSGSMNDQMMSTAIEATMALGLAMERIPGINLGISRFPIRGKYNGVKYVDDVQPLIVHGERIANHVKRFNIAARGSTPMANAMWYCYSQLLLQQSPRKILLVISDGRPDNLPRTVQAYHWGKTVGVETLGLGIKTNAIDKLFDITTSITDIEDLEGSLFSLARNVLTSAA